MKQEIYSSKLMYYSTSKKCINWVEIETKLDVIIDKELLENVVNDVLRMRYPYFAKKIIVADEELYLEDNDKRLQVYDLDGVDQYLFGEKNNEHLIRIATTDNKIGFFFFHGLSDAHGFTPFVKTVLFEYLCRQTGEIYSATAINDIHSKILESEYTDPLLGFQPKDDFNISYKPSLPQVAYKLPELLDAQGRKFEYRLKIKADSFMRYTKATDGSPNAIFALLLADAILRLHPESTDTIVPGIVVDNRRAINGENSFHSNIGLLFMRHSKKLEKLSFSKQATCYRGMVFLQSDDDVINQSVSNLVKCLQMMDNMPTLNAKRQFSEKVIAGPSNYCTCTISCPGKIDLGDVSRHIKSMYVRSDMTVSKLLVEICCVEDYFYVNIMQGFENPCYVNEIKKFLTEEKIHFEFSGPEILPNVYSDSSII